MLCDNYRSHSRNHTGEQHPESNRNHPGQPQRPRTRNEAPDTDSVLFPPYPTGAGRHHIASRK